MVPRSVPRIHGRWLWLLVIVTAIVAVLFYWNHLPSRSRLQVSRGEMMPL